MDKQTIPVIEICHANDAQEMLGQVPQEVRLIKNVLTPLHFEGVLEMDTNFLSQAEDLGKKWDYLRQRISVFHFSGHAAENHLQLSKQKKMLINIYKDLLGQAPCLKLAFLNGCATLAHVKELWQVGVPAVIATSEAILDTHACEFSHYFYDSMAKGARLEDAFNTARARLSEMQNLPLYDQFKIRYSIDEGKLSTGFAWGLYIQPQYTTMVNWRLQDGLAPPFNPLFSHAALSDTTADFKDYLDYIVTKLEHNKADGMALLELGLVWLYLQKLGDSFACFLQATEYSPIGQCYYYACLAKIAYRPLYDLPPEEMRQVKNLLGKALYLDPASPISPVYYLLLLAIIYDYDLRKGHSLTHDPEELIELIDAIGVNLDDLQRLVYFTDIREPKVVGLIQALSNPNLY